MTVLPLEGIRVLNLGSAASAPSLGRNLSDFGAEVLKAESSARLDTMRMMGNLRPDLPPDQSMNYSAPFNDFNRGVMSFQVNLKKPEGIELIKKLVKISDVFIENYSVGTMKKLELEYETLKKINPKIIMLSLSGVGQTGAYNDIVTYGPTVASLTGQQSMLGYSDGESAMDYGGSDFFAANMGLFLIAIALMHRDQTGKGQYIDMGQVEPTIYSLGEPVMDYAMNNRVSKKQGNWRRGFVPHNFYRCKPDETKVVPEDQWASIAVETEEEWVSFCKAIGNPSWTKENKFTDKEKRWQNQEEMDNLITEWTIKHTPYEIMSILQKAGVASTPMMNEAMIMTDPHHAAQETFKFVDLPELKGVPQFTPPLKLSDSPCVWRRAPQFGEHTNYVYGKLLGLSKDEIDGFKKAGIIN